MLQDKFIVCIHSLLNYETPFCEHTSYKNTHYEKFESTKKLNFIKTIIPSILIKLLTSTIYTISF